LHLPELRKAACCRRTPAAVPHARALPPFIPTTTKAGEQSTTRGPHAVGRRRWPGGATTAEGERRS
jgi:hypothetical protein